MDNTTKRTSDKPVIGITIGDYNGVGPETIIKVLQDKRITNICVPVIYGSGKILTKYKRQLGIENFNYHQFNENSYLNDKKPNVVNCWAEPQEVQPGKVTPEAGQCAFLALQKSTEDLKAKVIDAIVTSPINKANIQSEEFQFPGHTEYYSEAFGDAEKGTLMLLCSDDLRVGVITGHIPLSKVPESITKELIFQKTNVLLNSLKEDFGIQRPRVAILGLNPHAGEEGLLGREELDIIEPAVIEMKKKGNLVFGPYPADGFFGTMMHRKFDGVLAMYHDQGLIPFKTMAFESGVNYTAGLSIVRTSPDHGTAYNIAGKGLADEGSLREAIFQAVDIVKNRQNKVESQIRPNAKQLLSQMKEESKKQQVEREKEEQRLFEKELAEQEERQKRKNDPTQGRERKPRDRRDSRDSRGRGRRSEQQPQVEPKQQGKPSVATEGKEAVEEKEQAQPQPEGSSSAQEPRKPRQGRQRENRPPRKDRAAAQAPEGKNQQEVVEDQPSTQSNDTPTIQENNGGDVSQEGQKEQQPSSQKGGGQRNRGKKRWHKKRKGPNPNASRPQEGNS
ncbi:4-hydroxythreonine-4-phosphate dehydrogenase PdxA [Algivirga pacifica]|uniref:4-hydroxythreonine-4-phosphate dehydrogenase PdxA n=1 Tax=Algivirga pacifica TaxID=1162670 RepID=A0ABP9DDI3_9BACT